MLSEREVTAAIGSTAYGDGGEKLGTVESFFVDDRTGEPTWVALTTGLLGTRHAIAPAREATWVDGRLELPVTAGAVKSAPAMGGHHLSPVQEDELRRHYGSSGGVSPAATDTATADTTAVDTTAADTAVLPAAPPDLGNSSPRHAAGESTDGAMTRSEERLVVGTERVPDRRVRVVKYVVTEEVQVTVPIRREEIRIEEVPLDAADGIPGEPPGGDAPAPAALPEEIVLHAERPVVTVEVVPVERVRLRTELVQTQETVSGQVRREQVVVDRDAQVPRGG